MSDLELIKHVLQNNPDIIMKERLINYLPDTDSDGYGQKVNLWIAPIQGIYSHGKLQEFMEGLLPQYKPLDKDDFYKKGGILHLGKLYYLEEILKIEEILSMADKEALKDDESLIAQGFGDGNRTIDEKGHHYIARLIIVRPVPNQSVLEDILNKTLFHNDIIDLSELKTYKTKIL